jgi:hypothetical protein
MKKLLLFLIPLAALAMTGCGKNDEGNKFWISYGTVETVDSRGEPATIRRDDGARLAIAANNIPQAVFEEGDRLWLHYNILGDTPDGYSIRLNSTQTILCKQPVLASEVDEEDHVGEDPVIVREAWFGGKYLNIHFEVGRQDSQKAHYINLVVDDLNAYPVQDGEVHVTLKHSAEGDPQTRRSSGLVSFDLMSLIPDQGTNVDIVLHWEDFEGEKQDDGNFVPWGGNETPRAAEQTSTAIFG